MELIDAAIDIMLNNIAQIVLLADMILIVIMLFWERNDPKSTMIWIVVLLLVPFLGFFLYLFFGQTFYTTRTFRKKASEDNAETIVHDVEETILNKEHRMHPNNDGKIEFVNIIRNAGGMMYSNSNEVIFMPESEEYFKNLLKDLKNAEKSIHFEYYIIRNDEISNELMDILIERAGMGIEVRLMIDAIGNNKGPKKKIRELKEAGGEYSLFHSTLTCLLSPRKNNRNHRKIAVIDGKIGYVGGYNIGDEYLGKGPFGFWRDSAVRIDGPTVAALQFRFLADWRYATKKDLISEKEYYRVDISPGNISAQLISGGPDTFRINPIHMQYFNIVSSAKHTLYIHTPYLGPDDSLVDALRRAAYSGVDVRIIMPNIGDHIFVYWANRYYASLMLEAGIKIYEYNKGFVHSKTMVADGYYCSVGSANLDERSMKLNFESNMMLYSSEIGSEMDAAFMNDLKDCTEYDMEMYRNRTVFQKLKTGICRLFSNQL